MKLEKVSNNSTWLRAPKNNNLFEPDICDCGGCLCVCICTCILFG